MVRRAAFLSIFSVLCLNLGCNSPKTKFSYFHPESTLEKPVALLDKVKKIEKQEFENIRFETIAQNPLSSHHLVVIRKGEPLHYHAAHDGWALVIKGRGDFLIGGKRIPLYPGASVFIPRGVRHRATRLGKDSLAAFVIFTPPYDGKDMIPVVEK